MTDQSRERFVEWWNSTDNHNPYSIWQAAERATREECAQIAEQFLNEIFTEHNPGLVDNYKKTLAESIRQGSEK